MKLCSNLMIVLVLVFAGEIAPAKSIETAKLHSLLFGCWENERFDGGPDNRLIGSYLVCFRKDGWATGLTFDAGDAWEWSYDYRIEGNLIYFGETSWAQIKKIGEKAMAVEMKDKRMDFELVCRSKQENLQCERLEAKLTR
jgi:hypothetical protein